MDSALHRVPGAAADRHQEVYNGPESFTPDNQFILGEAPGFRGFFVGGRVQLGRHRLGAAAPAGRWPSGSSRASPTSDLTAVDIRRFAPFNANNRWLRDRVGEVLGLHYAVPWPNRELATARPFRRSPAPSPARRPGACFGSKMGWERPNVFAPPGRGPRHRVLLGRPELAAPGRGRAARDPGARGASSTRPRSPSTWSPGRDAEPALQWLCTADVAVQPGRAVYTGHAERARHLRVRPDRDPAFRNWSSCWSASAATTERDKRPHHHPVPAGSPRRRWWT